MVIIGIDPGTRKCGYGLLHIEKFKIIAAGSGIITIRPNISIDDKLFTLGNELKRIIKEYKPDIAAVETIFYGKNLQTSFILGHARGVVIYCLKESMIPVYSYTPREIKQSVSGRGNATKKQIEFVVQSLLNLKEPAREDAADGLACAICLFNKERFNLG